MGGIFIRYKVFLISILSALLLFCGCTKKETVQPEDESVKQENTEDTQKEPVEEEQYYTNYNATIEFVPETYSFKTIEKIMYKNTTGKKQNELYMNVYANAFTENAEQLPYLLEYENAIFKNGKSYMDFNISSLTVGGKEVTYSINGTSLCIQLSEPLEKDAQTEITIQFETSIPDMHYDIGRNQNVIWEGNILPVMAVYDNSGWNKSEYYPLGDSIYNDIGNYMIAVKTPENYDVIATGSEIINIDNGVKTTVIEAKFTRDFAFAIGSGMLNKSVQTDVSGVKINLYYYTYDDEKANAILNRAKETLEYYIETLGSYPYSHIDIVECSLYDNKDVQFTGIAFIDESWFMPETDINTAMLNFNLGKQWFSEIIGSNGVKEPWLRAGFEKFLQRLFVYGEYGIDDAMEIEYASLKTALASEKHIELHNGLDTYKTKESFENIQVRKAAMMMYALYKEVGSEKFHDIIKEYCLKYSFKNITSNEFFNLSEDIYGKSLYSLFNDWVNGNKLPKVNFEKITDETENLE